MEVVTSSGLMWVSRGLQAAKCHDCDGRKNADTRQRQLPAHANKVGSCATCELMPERTRNIVVGNIFMVKKMGSFTACRRGEPLRAICVTLLLK